MNVHVFYFILSRLVNNLMYYHIRRCYLYSEQEDVDHMEMLCSFMYREAVYIARKGYFARDVFIEHSEYIRFYFATSMLSMTMVTLLTSISITN